MKIQNKCRNISLIHLNTQNKRCIRNTSLQKGFTLVELIVVVAILAILSTIGFISFTGYLADARDTKRLGALDGMKAALVLYKGQHGLFPMPTDSEEITYSGEIVWYQGIFGDSVITRVGEKSDMSEVPKDPLTFNEYTYSITNNKKEYQLAVVFEGLEANILNKQIANASGEYGYTKLDGNYNGKVLRVGTCSNLKLIASPSIVKGDTEKTELTEILAEKKLVYNNSQILPSSYESATDFVEELPDLPIVNTSSIETFEGTCRDLKELNNQEDFMKNLVQAYVGTELENIDNTIKNIVEEPSLYDAQVILHETATPLVEVTASEDSIIVGAGEAGDTGSNSEGCEFGDLTIGTQTWAGCNSTIGDGVEFTRNDDEWSCWDYQGHTGATCTDDENLSTHKAIDWNSTYGIDNIWGKLYTWENAKNTACADGYHLPSKDELETLINYLEDNKGDDEIGWDVHTSGTSEDNLVEALQIPLVGFQDDTGINAYRGYQGVYWSDTGGDSDDVYVVGVYAGGSTAFIGTIENDYLMPVRCIKD